MAGLHSTKAWQRTRLVVLERSGGWCEVRGPRCTQRATCVHHVFPASQYPHLFFELTNLRASCRNCNSTGSAGGAAIAAQNRSTRRMVDYLEHVVEQQRQQIEELHAELTRRDEPVRQVVPRIH